MTKTIPSYLRVHRDELASELSEIAAPKNLPGDLWDAYSEATGWRIDQRARRAASHVEVLPAVSSERTNDSADSAVPVVTRSAATRLAQSAAHLEDELAKNRLAMRRQQAELAARASLVEGSLERERLADRIETTLADVVEACGCDAAAMYMLDDLTTSLSTRAVFGLPPNRLEDESRSLRGSRGDLEAMVRGVVMIDDLHACSIDTWSCPEQVMSAAICAVIQADDVPIGTLWLYSKEVCEFGKPQAAAARMAASHLSLLLSQASAPDSTPEADTAIHDVSRWQCEALPVGSNLAENWRVDGMIESPQPWATGFHHWDVLPDGTLMLVIAEAVDSSAKGAMSATIARAAMASHIGYRHTPKQLLQRVSDTLWQTSTGEQLVSMLYARVDPETGEGEVAAAGSITAMIASKYGYRPLVDGQSEPLNSHIEANCYCESFHMLAGETLLGYSHGLLKDGATQLQLGEGLRAAMRAEDANPLASLRRQLASLTLNYERGAATLLRI